VHSEKAVVCVQQPLQDNGTMSWLPLLESCCSQIDFLLVKIEHEVTVQLPAAAIMALLLLLRLRKFRTQK